MFIAILDFLRSLGSGRKNALQKPTYASSILQKLDEMIAEAPKSVAPPSVAGPHTYELMIPGGYGQQIRVERSDDQASASITSFGDSIKGLTYVFTGSDTSNFYFLDHYFVVSVRMLEFLCEYCRELEFVPITVRQEIGIPCLDDYVAVSIPPSLDCIDPSNSFGYQEYPSTEEALPLSDLLSKNTDRDSSTAQLMKSKSNDFVFPREHRIKNIALNKNVVPDDCVLFRPRHSPGFLIVSSKFANRLRFEIKGGNSGYHFWTLDLNRVKESLSDHFRWYR